VQGSPSLGQAPVSGLNNQRVAYTGSDNSMLLLLGGGMLLLGLALAVGAARRRRQAS
jgi:LPXTG-motif cell wall-anchored protein